MLKKMTVRDLSQEQLGGKRVLMRVDYNVPLDESGQVAEDERIRATLPSLAYLAGRGARIVLMSHLGRPNGVRVPSLTLRAPGPPGADRDSRRPGSNPKWPV